MGLRAAMMLGLAGSAAFGACTGDTLYDSGAVPPPAIEIVSPRAGDEFVAGEAIDVQVLAEDTLRVRALELTFTFMTETDTTADTVQLTIAPSLEAVDSTTAIEARAEPGELELRAAATNELNAVGRSLPVTVQVRRPEVVAF